MLLGMLQYTNTNENMTEGQIYGFITVYNSLRDRV